MTSSLGTGGAPTVEILDSGGAWQPVDGLLLEVDQLHVEFRARDGIAKAINGVSFDLHQGETLAILGESGSGKSVTAQAIMGILDSPPGFVTGGEVRYGSGSFQGKGFRSLGQEAIYAAAIRLRRGDAWASESGWQGDVVGPIIRDVGVALAMRPELDTVRMVLNAQVGKQGPPMDGKDLHIGDFEWGILPATAPLSML